MNRSAIYKVFKYSLSNLKLQISVMLGAFAIGFLLVFVNVRLIDNDDYAHTGSFMAYFLFCFSMICMSVKSFSIDFKNIIKMGICRKNYIIGINLYCLVSSMAITVLIALLFRLEVFVTASLYSGIPLEELFEKTIAEEPYLPFAVSLCVVLLCPISGAIWLKFGRKGFIALYFAFILWLGSLTNETIKNALFEIKESPALAMLVNAELPVKILVVSVMMLALIYASIRTILKTEIA